MLGKDGEIIGDTQGIYWGWIVYILRIDWECIRIMERKMETTI